MDIGFIIKTQDQLSEAIQFCKDHPECEVVLLSNGDMTISLKDNSKKEEQLAKMEAETGLTRAIREFIDLNNLSASEYVLSKVKEMNALAEEIRNHDSSPITEEPIIETEGNESGTELIESEDESK